MQIGWRKYYLTSLLLFIVQIVSVQITHAEATTAPHNYAILLSQPRHVKGVLMMLNSMKKDQKKLQYSKARVVLYGEAIHTTRKNSEITKLIEQAKKEDVTIAVCNQAMKRLEVPTSDILPTVEIVENAYYEMLRLKTLGYISLDL